MKQLVSTYTFDASAKTITFAIDFTLEQMLLITNVTDNIIIYNFADPTCGGSITNNVLTLDYNTTSMNDTDKLQIFVEIEDTCMIDALYEMIRMLNLMRNDGGMADTAGRVRCAVESLPTLGTVTTVTTLANQTSSGGYQTTLATIAGSNNSPKFNRQYITIS